MNLEFQIISKPQMSSGAYHVLIACCVKPAPPISNRWISFMPSTTAEARSLPLLSLEEILKVQALVLGSCPKASDYKVAKFRFQPLHWTPRPEKESPAPCCTNSQGVAIPKQHSQYCGGEAPSGSRSVCLFQNHTKKSPPRQELTHLPKEQKRQRSLKCFQGVQQRGKSMS